MLRLKRHIERAIDEKILHSSYKLTLSSWVELEEMMQLLKPFQAIQQLLEGESYVTVSFLPAAVKHLREQLLQVSEDDGNYSVAVQELAEKMLKKLDEEFTPRSDEPGEYFRLNSTRSCLN